MVGNFSIFNALTDSSVNLGEVKNNDASDVKKDADNDNDTKGKARDLKMIQHWKRIET